MPLFVKERFNVLVGVSVFDRLMGLKVCKVEKLKG
jgi:hypothetical protein